MLSKLCLKYKFNFNNKNILNFIFTPLRIAPLIVALSFCLHHTTAYATETSSQEQQTTTKKADGKNNPLLISTEDPELKAEQDFDKIKSYESYDPITDTWSTIEDFEDVEIVEEVEKKPTTRYIYRSFWAYDPSKNEWYRVDINEYGYRKITVIDEDEEKKKWRFWKNLGLSVSAGLGGTYHMYHIKNLDLKIRKEQKEFFLENRDKSGKVYKIQWLNQRPVKISTLEHANMANAYTPITHDHTFKGLGPNFPLTIALHYTFFNRLRIGVGLNYEINSLKILSWAKPDIEKVEYEVIKHWFYNIKYFGTLGYKIYKGKKHALLIDGKIGMARDYGDKDFSLMEYEYSNLYASVGPYHEIRLNNFFKFFYGFSLQWKNFHNNADFGNPNNSDAKPSMFLWQPGAYLEVGITVNFGSDKEEEEPEQEEEQTEEGQNQDKYLDDTQSIEEGKDIDQLSGNANEMVAENDASLAQNDELIEPITNEDKNEEDTVADLLDDDDKLKSDE